MSINKFVHKCAEGNIPDTKHLGLNKVLKDYIDDCKRYNLSKHTIVVELTSFIVFNNDISSIINNL